MDYSSMKATKTTKQNQTKNISVSKKSAKNIKKTSKKTGISLVLVIFFLIVGFCGGFAVSKVICANDIFEMTAYENGNIDIYIGQDETYNSYTELGVKCVAFGKDISDDCTVTYFYRNDLTEEETQVDGVDENAPGIYYAVYKCKNIKYSSVTLIRNIIVLKEEDNG